MKSTQKQRQKLLKILIVLTLVFIWGNSMIPGDLSRAFSVQLTETLGGEVADENDPQYKNVKEIRDGNWYLRKGAHFAEFMLLSGELTLFFSLRGEKGREKRLLLACAGMAVPLLDETIQMFTHRSPMVRDIWIDIAGYATGCLLVSAALRVRRRAKE